MKVVNKVEESGRLVYNSDIVRDIVACALHEIKGIILGIQVLKMTDEEYASKKYTLNSGIPM